MNEDSIAIPLYASHISAGFPSPADDYIEAELDLNRFMVRNPPDTFMTIIKGDVPSGAGILDGNVSSLTDLSAPGTA